MHRSVIFLKIIISGKYVSSNRNHVVIGIFSILRLVLVSIFRLVLNFRRIPDGNYPNVRWLIPCWFREYRDDIFILSYRLSKQKSLLRCTLTITISSFLTPDKFWAKTNTHSELKLLNAFENYERALFAKNSSRLNFEIVANTVIFFWMMESESVRNNNSCSKKVSKIIILQAQRCSLWHEEQPKQKKMINRC